MFRVMRLNLVGGKLLTFNGFDHRDQSIDEAYFIYLHSDYYDDGLLRDFSIEKNSALEPLMLPVA